MIESKETQKFITTAPKLEVAINLSILCNKVSDFFNVLAYQINTHEKFVGNINKSTAY
jgi:hypothetical protein